MDCMVAWCLFFASPDPKVGVRSFVKKGALHGGAFSCARSCSVSDVISSIPGTAHLLRSLLLRDHAIEFSIYFVLLLCVVRGGRLC